MRRHRTKQFFHLITLLTMAVNYGGCATKTPPTVVEIRYLVVVDPALPFVEDEQVKDWLKRAEEIFKETGEISIRFVPVGKVHLASFLNSDKWGQRNWFQSPKTDEQVDSLIESRLRQYDLNYIKDYFKGIKRKGSLSQSSFQNDVQKRGEPDIEFFKRETKGYLLANVEAYRKKLKIREADSDDHQTFSLMIGWQNALKDLKGADMILTNEIGADIYTLGQVFSEYNFRVGFTSGLADFENARFIVSIFPWYYSRPTDSISTYDLSRDDYVPAAISHELAHALFHLQHDYSKGNFIMSASEDTQTKWYHQRPRFSNESQSEIKAWVLVKRANKLKQGQRYQEAVFQLRNSIQVKKDYQPAYQLLSEIYDRLGQKDLAVQAREESNVIGNRSRWLETYSAAAYSDYAKAKELKLLGRSEEAIEEYKKVVSGDNPNKALNYDLLRDLVIETYRDMGTLYTNQLNHDEAIGILTKLLQLEPKDPKALYLLGRNFYFKKDKTNAITALKNFLAVEKEGMDAESARTLLTELSEDKSAK